MFFNIQGGIRSSRRFLPVAPLRTFATRSCMQMPPFMKWTGDANEWASWAQEDVLFDTETNGITAPLGWGQGWWKLPTVCDGHIKRVTDGDIQSSMLDKYD